MLDASARHAYPDHVRVPRMRGLLGCDDAVLRVAAFCAEGALETFSATCWHGLCCALWTVLSQGRPAGRAALLAWDAGLMGWCCSWAPLPALYVPPGYGNSLPLLKKNKCPCMAA